MLPSIQIKIITAPETWPLRRQLLRPFDVLESCKYPDDLAFATFHFGAFDSKSLIGIASFSAEICRQRSARNPFRLRGMATLPSLRKQGIGRALVQSGIQELLTRKSDLLWFNARELAFAFYERLGFLYSSELFDIPGSGPHKVMYNYLESRLP